MRIGVGFALIAALSGCAAPGVADRTEAAQRLASELAGYRQGDTQDCLPTTLDKVSPRIVDDRTIVYSRTRSEKWVSTLPTACPGLRPTSTLIVQRFGSQTCRLDRFQTIEPGLSNIPGPICTFGTFVRYDRP